MGKYLSARLGVLMLALLLPIAAFFSAGLSPQEIPLRLAGQAKYPSPQALSWQQTQADGSIAAEDKIKSTIDTYFIVIYESLKTLELLDFGFLFDLNDVNAWNDYAYERGTVHVRVEVNKVQDRPLILYTYKPKYFSIKINGESAAVSMMGFADWIKKGYGGRVDTSPWHEHKFSLAFLNGQWRIKRACCTDVEHNTYPRDTDFNKAAEEAVQAIMKYKKREAPALWRRAEISKKLASERYGKSLLESWSFNRSKCQSYALTYSNNVRGWDSYNLLFKYWVADPTNFFAWRRIGTRQLQALLAGPLTLTYLIVSPPYCLLQICGISLLTDVSLSRKNASSPGSPSVPKSLTE